MKASPVENVKASDMMSFNKWKEARSLFYD